MAFSTEEKCALFDKIEAAYYRQNFGSMSKADLETLLFSVYMDHRISHKERYDDYTLSKILGITQTRIRALKERKGLQYPYLESESSWKEALAEAMKDARYDDGDKHVRMVIQDVNVMNELKHYIEERGWYDDCSLNRKLLNIPLKCFIEIFIDEDEIAQLLTDEAKKAVKRIKNKDSVIEKFLHDFTKEGFNRFLANASSIAIRAVLLSLPFTGGAKTAVGFVVSMIS